MRKLALALAAAGCATVQPSGTTYRLSVEPALPHSDGLIDIRADTLLPGAVLLNVGNLSDATVRIVWDDAAYTDTDGYSSRVVPGETRVLDITRSQPSTPIPAAARTRVWAISTEHEAGDPVLNSADDAGAVCDMVGRSIRLTVPVEVAGGRREYELRWTVRDAFISSLGGDWLASGFDADYWCSEARF